MLDDFWAHFLTIEWVQHMFSALHSALLNKMFSIFSPHKQQMNQMFPSDSDSGIRLTGVKALKHASISPNTHSIAISYTIAIYQLCIIAYRQSWTVEPVMFLESYSVRVWRGNEFRHTKTQNHHIRDAWNGKKKMCGKLHDQNYMNDPTICKCRLMNTAFFGMGGRCVF